MAARPPECTLPCAGRGGCGGAVVLGMGVRAGVLRRRGAVVAASAALVIGCCVLLMNTTTRTPTAAVELAAKDAKPAGPSHEKPGSGGRGRGHAVAADDSQAHRLKEKAEREDKQSRSLRMQANKDYDQASELMRKAGVITHSMAREAKKEHGLQSVIASDKADISADERRLTRVGLLKKEISKVKVRVHKDLDADDKANAVLSATGARLRLDKKHLRDQRRNVGKLLSDAGKYANEAESSLKKSQVCVCVCVCVCVYHPTHTAAIEIYTVSRTDLT
jgi:hypothetical protein